MKNVVIMADPNPRAAIATIRALKGFDVNLFLVFSRGNSFYGRFAFKGDFKKSFFYYKKNSKEDFISSIISIKDQIGEYILFPYGEKQLRWAIYDKEYLSQNGVMIPTVDYYKYELISNKASFSDFCETFSIDVPAKKEWDISKFQQKFVIKPKKLVENPRVLQCPLLIENEKSFLGLKKLNLNPEMHFIQEYIQGPSIYYCVCYQKGIKKISFSQINLKQQPNGKSVIKAAPYELPIDIINKIDEMFFAIRWDGVVMIEVKYDLETKKYYAIEANPRFWGPLQLSIDNGVNFPAALLGFNTKNQIKRADRGYLWLNGYIQSLTLKSETNTHIQCYHQKSDKNIKYYDIWLRYDTFFYFFVENVVNMVSLLNFYIMLFIPLRYFRWFRCK